MTRLFDPNRTYTLGDPDLDILGSRELLAQWRHKNIGPPYYKIGRKIVYHGADLNTWAEANKFGGGAE